MPKRSRAGGKAPAGNLLSAAIGVLEADGWPFTRMPEQPVLYLGFRGQNGTWNCYAQALDDRGQFIFFSVCPLNAPEALRPAALDFLNRANHGLAVGNFEMDAATGEIRLRTSLVIGTGPAQADWLRPVIQLNVAVMDVYLPALMSVLWGSASPAEAIARVEAGSE